MFYLIWMASCLTVGYFLFKKLRKFSEGENMNETMRRIKAQIALNIINIRHVELWQFFCDSFGIDFGDDRFCVTIGGQHYEIVKRLGNSNKGDIE